MFEIFAAVLFLVITGWVVLNIISKINYTLDSQYLRILIGSFSVRKIAIKDISEVKVGANKGGENWTNTLHRPTILKRAITICRSSGWFERMVITPDHRENFVNRIKNHPFYIAKDL